MINFGEQIFEQNGFRLEVYPMVNEAEDEGFIQGDPAASIQCGADFHLSYTGSFSGEPVLGILQFVRSEVDIGQPPRSISSNICLDKEIKDGYCPLVDYLFGNPETTITYKKTKFLNKPTAVWGINKCEIYDIPREGHKIANQKLVNSPVRIEFWDFIVRIENDYGYISPSGIKWQMEFAQIGNENNYTCNVEFGAAKFSDLDYKNIFHTIIYETSYKISESLR